MMGRKIKEKTLYLGLKFVDNLDLPKDYRLEEKERNERRS